MVVWLGRRPERRWNGGLPTAGVLTLINYFWVLGANGQALHDIAANSILVRVESV